MCDFTQSVTYTVCNFIYTVLFVLFYTQCHTTLCVILRTVQFFTQYQNFQCFTHCLILYTVYNLTLWQWQIQRHTKTKTSSKCIEDPTYTICFLTRPDHLGPFGVMRDHFWSWRAIFGAVLGHYGAPVALWKGPRVVQHDKISCIIPMGSVLGPFGVM